MSEVNWVPFGLRLRLTEDKKLEVWNIDDEVRTTCSQQLVYHGTGSKSESSCAAALDSRVLRKGTIVALSRDLTHADQLNTAEIKARSVSVNKIS